MHTMRLVSSCFRQVGEVGVGCDKMRTQEALDQAENMLWRLVTRRDLLNQFRHARNRGPSLRGKIGGGRRWLIHNLPRRLSGPFWGLFAMCRANANQLDPVYIIACGVRIPAS